MKSSRHRTCGQNSAVHGVDGGGDCRVVGEREWGLPGYLLLKQYSGRGHKGAIQGCPCAYALIENAIINEKIDVKIIDT
jgi:hypothetical protein